MSDEKKLLQFPTHFPIKIFGINSDALLNDISKLAKEKFPNLKEKDIKHNVSKNNNYLSITINLYVHNQAELDALYIAVNQHPDVKMVL